jgi:acyl transferase domain-containing protein
LARVCHTLQTGREPMKYRFACVFSEVKELMLALESAESGALLTDSFMTAVAPGPTIPSQHDGEISSASEFAQFRQTLSALAQAWTQGAEVVWTRWTRLVLPPLSGLPTYPFRKSVYWTSALGPADKTDASSLLVPSDPTSTTEPSSEVTPPSQKLRVDTSMSIHELKTLIIEIVRKLLDYDAAEELDEARSFSEMGFGSISIVQLAHELTKVMGRHIPETIAFDHPKISDLAMHLAAMNVCAARPIDPKPNAFAVGRRTSLPTTREKQDSDIREALIKIADGKLTLDEAERLIF